MGEREEFRERSVGDLEEQTSSAIVCPTDVATYEAMDQSRTHFMIQYYVQCRLLYLVFVKLNICMDFPVTYQISYVQRIRTPNFLVHSITSTVTLPK
jgi:hypothetical protein